MATLRPTGKVTLASSDKFFTKGQLGRSSGSEEVVEFEVLLTDMDTDRELTRAILEARRKMDGRVLVSEYLRGALTAAQFEDLRHALKVRYAKVLGADEPEEEA